MPAPRSPPPGLCGFFLLILATASLTGVLLSSGDLDQTALSSHTAWCALGLWMLQKYIWSGECKRSQAEQVCRWLLFPRFWEGECLPSHPSQLPSFTPHTGLQQRRWEDLTLRSYVKCVWGPDLLLFFHHLSHHHYQSGPEQTSTPTQ